MYQKFDVINITAYMQAREVIIEMTMDVDASTVNTDTVFFANADDNRLLPYDLVVDKKTIRIKLKDWPSPNKEHLLMIRKEITSVSELELNATYKRTVVFPSVITSTVVVTSPSDHERVENLGITWSLQTNDSSATVSSYYLEIADDAAFYNIVRFTTVYDRTSIILTDIPEGQYFVRVRAQNETDYGSWSEPVSFLYQTSAANSYNTPQQDTNDSPAVIDEILTVAPERSEDNITPTAFVYTFNKPLDITKISGLVVTRRDF